MSTPLDQFKEKLRQQGASVHRTFDRRGDVMSADLLGFVVRWPDGAQRYCIAVDMGADGFNLFAQMDANDLEELARCLKANELGNAA